MSINLGVSDPLNFCVKVVVNKIAFLIPRFTVLFKKIREHIIVLMNIQLSKHYIWIGLSFKRFPM